MNGLRKDYKLPVFQKNGETNLDDIEAVFKDSEEHHVTEKNEQQSTAMNAFELISMSKGLNLENLFDTEQVLMGREQFSSLLSTLVLMPLLEGIPLILSTISFKLPSVSIAFSSSSIQEQITRLKGNEFDFSHI
ncbi:hypothetical protein GYH30_020902 [Glycine max]|nr:hypothetical protein GYH30_020902 [Glycine max]